jgi:hypothetical protein
MPVNSNWKWKFLNVPAVGGTQILYAFAFFVAKLHNFYTEKEAYGIIMSVCTSV